MELVIPMLIRKSICLLVFWSSRALAASRQTLFWPNGDFIQPTNVSMESDVRGDPHSEGDVDSLPLPSTTQCTRKQSAKRRSANRIHSTSAAHTDLFGITEIPATPFEPGRIRTDDAVLIAWDEGLAAFMLDLIEATVLGSDVWIVTWSLDETRLIERLLEVRGIDRQKVRFFEFPHESFWSRDYGPISVVDENGQVSFVDARYIASTKR